MNTEDRFSQQDTYSVIVYTFHCLVDTAGILMNGNEDDTYDTVISAGLETMRSTIGGLSVSEGIEAASKEAGFSAIVSEAKFIPVGLSWPRLDGAAEDSGKSPLGITCSVLMKLEGAMSDQGLDVIAESAKSGLCSSLAGVGFLEVEECDIKTGLGLVHAEATLMRGDAGLKIAQSYSNSE